MSPRDERLTGLEAARRVLEEAKREEFVAADLVARALRCSRRRLLRDWEGRGHPVTALGQFRLLAARLVLQVYFGHVGYELPVKSHQTGHAADGGRFHQVQSP
jgi:hypothetical protein